jgi:molybdenum cofactor cytidylyltransferase
VVPAAGLSRRMGREKVLLPFRGRTLLETVLATLAEAGTADPIVVVRPDLAEAVRLARAAGARVVENPDPGGEMLASIRMGAALLGPEVEAFFVWPADHPAVAADTLRALAREGHRDRAAVPIHRSRRGHPVLIGRGLLADLERLPPATGLRGLWRIRPEALVEVPVEDPGVLLDLDTPEAYENAIREE